MKKTRQILLTTFLFSIVFLIQHESRGQVNRPKPNIVCILVDDLGYSDLSSYGGTDVRTPHIDKLISGGMKMTRFYSNSPVCSPTRAALMTGKYPDLVGVPGVIRVNPLDNWGYLSPQEKLLPEFLKKAGYATALVGKWHLGLEAPNLPNQRGFDYFNGFLEGMVDDNYNHLREGQNFFRLNNQTINPEGHPTDIFTSTAIQYLNQQKRAHQPFFLYLAYTAPHIPLQAPLKFVEEVRKREPGISEQRMKLVSTIEHLDEGIGKVVQALKDNGQYEKTLIVFTSDNGGQLNAGASCKPWRGGKEDLYEGGIRVPFGVSWPGTIAPRVDSTTVALTMDLFPTLCDIAQATYTSAINGRSLLSVWRNKASVTERDLIWMRREGNPRYQGQDYYAIQRGEWKLVQNHPFKPYELYNLKDDPLETKDLAEVQKEKWNELAKALREHILKTGSVPWQKEGNSKVR